MINYNKRLVEVDEILKHLPKNDYEKIPKEIKDVIRENKDKEYQWKYDEKKKLKEQNVNDDTIAILSYINMEYLLNKEQKAFVEKLHQINDQNHIKKEVFTETKYDNKELFTKKNNDKKEQSKQILVLEHKENIFKRLLNKILNKIKNF